MKFLVDAQLPRRLAYWLNEAGQNTLHTLDLPRGNLTTDAELIECAHQQGRIVTVNLFFTKLPSQICRWQYMNDWLRAQKSRNSLVHRSNTTALLQPICARNPHPSWRSVFSFLLSSSFLPPRLSQRLLHRRE